MCRVRVVLPVSRQRSRPFRLPLRRPPKVSSRGNRKEGRRSVGNCRFPHRNDHRDWRVLRLRCPFHQPPPERVRLPRPHTECHRYDHIKAVVFGVDCPATDHRRQRYPLFLSLGYAVWQLDGRCPTARQSPRLSYAPYSGSAGRLSPPRR